MVWDLTYAENTLTTTTGHLKAREGLMKIREFGGSAEQNYCVNLIVVCVGSIEQNYQ
jgi:hypothetical protein